MSDRPTTELLGTTTARLSLAVDLVDRFTGREPVGTPRLRIEGRDAEPVQNPSGYYVFLDLEPDTVTLVVDGGKHYVDREVTDVEVIDLSDPNTTVDPSDPETLPLETVELVPAPPYQFPAGATLVRGTVYDPDGDPLPDATVSTRNWERETGSDSVQNRGLETRTDGNGEFVLFFKPVTDADVTSTDGRTVLEVDGSPPGIAVSHHVHGDTDVRLEDDGGSSSVEEGALTVQDVSYT